MNTVLDFSVVSHIEIRACPSRIVGHNLKIKMVISLLNDEPESIIETVMA
ncbi:MAG: hypothetical protein L6Q98_24110 [Anaerolineae bacterium]|nr:hypothetical protein [Anaerolineae bacterium]NUQ07329.1 hypothetical protein [Anaerolineae bacterium]